MAWKTRANPRIVPSDWGSRKRAVHARDGGICHVCRHADADQVDHILNVARGGSHELDNLALIHGGACPTCGQRCHTAKTAHESHVNRPRRNRPAEKHPGLL